MDQPKPLITVVLPIQNASAYVKKCLESILKQTYQNFELIAIDDFSTDDSYTLLKRYKKLDKRIKISRNKKRYGVSTVFNRAVKRAHGSFVAFVDPRDFLHSKRLQKQVEFLLSNPKVAAVGTQCTHIDTMNKRIGKSHFPADHESICQMLFSGVSMYFNSTMINRLIVPKDLLYFKANSYPVIFTDVFMKLIKYAHVANLKEALHYHRQLSHKPKPAKKRIVSHVKLWLKAVAMYEERPSLKSLIAPLLRTRMTTN